MKIRVHRHAHHYGILLAFLLCGMVAFMLAGGSTSTQFWLAVLVSLGYAAWGVLHHLHAGDLNRKIVVEYALFVAVAISILWALLLP